MGKRILITTTSRERLIVRRGVTKPIHGFCMNCREEAEMLTLDQCVSFSAKSSHELIRQIESGVIHSIETTSGHLLICQNSLKHFLQGEKK